MEYIVIGAGPSGLMCAYKLKESGHEVIILEKEEKVGKKIYITGKGRCNVTNNCSSEEFFQNVVTNSKFLFSAYNNFNSQDTMDFFTNNGVELISERGNRVFPKSYKAGDIAQCLYEANKNIGVKIHLNEAVKSIYKQNDVFIVNTTKASYSAQNIVLATGGLSYPHTGSTGDGYKLAQSLGHQIIDPVAALCALRIKEQIPQNLYKFTLKNVKITANCEDFTKSEFGEITFYKEGIAGAAALTLSSQINRQLNKQIQLSIDLKPALETEKLDARLLREIKNPKNKTINDLLLTLLPSELMNFFLMTTKINPDTPLVTLTKEERLDILKSLKNWRFDFCGLDDIERATVTSGGVPTKEINPKTLESKIVSGLFFAGEIIDVDAYTGGFNLQIAFSTGALIAKKN